VELTTLTARVGRHRKIGKELLVEQASGEFGVKLSGINADETSGEALRDEASSKDRCVETPDREEWLESAASQQPLPIRAYVLEKEIAERDVGYIG
jgi:hypothetical protein